MTSSGLPSTNLPVDNRRLLFCCRATPEYYRQPLFSTREVFCGPDCADTTTEDGRIVSLRTPAGEYDINAVVARLPAEQRPDLVIVKADATRGNFPRGLDRLRCPKVLVVGDTHHFPAPLRHMLRYAGMETFEAIIVDHTRQHAHFFQDMGFERVYWIPAVDYALRYRATPRAPSLPLTFVGQVGAFHPYRRHVLEQVRRAGHPLKIRHAAPEETADIQAASRITLNCSLNGDLNLRVFEALGAGAFLLTDRLSPQAGLERLFEAGRHLDIYAGPDELNEKIRHYLAHPEETQRIRAAGQAHLLATHSPAAMRRRFFDLLDHQRVDPVLDLAGERRGSHVASREALIRRTTAYEAIQQRHLETGRLTLWVDDDDALAITSTAIDLPRVRLAGAVGEIPPPPVGKEEEEILVLPWPEAAATAAERLAGFDPGNDAHRVLAIGKNWRDQQAVAAFLAGWGMIPDGEEGLFRCNDPFRAAERAFEHLPATVSGPRIAALSDAARTAEQAWRGALLAQRLSDPLPYERLLLRCVSLDRGHRPALQALATLATATGRDDDARLYAAEYARLGGNSPSPDHLANDMSTPRLSAYRAVTSPLPRVTPGGLRILIVTNLFPPQEFGGYGRKLWEFTAELQRRGHQIKVLTADIPSLTRPGVVGAVDLEPIVERSLRLYGVWRNGIALMHDDAGLRQDCIAANDRRITNAAADFAADVCLVGNIDLLSHSFLTLLLERGIPIIHCIGNHHPGYAPAEAPRSPLYRLGTASEWVAATLGDNGLGDIAKTVLYPGGRTDSFYRPIAPARDRLRIAFASLLTPYKGPQVLANALAILHHNDIDFECTFAGEAPDPAFTTNLQKFCAKFGDRVQFPGFLDRRGVGRLFDRSNVLAFPSVFEEPFGITQVEAMAAGLLVISSGSGGSGEIIRHEQEGLISPPGNAEALAYALASLPNDRLRWGRLARQGQARSLSFTVGRSVNRIEAAFTILLEKKRALA